MSEGSCLCGALRYAIDDPFVDMLHCHCSMCRKHHGSAFATWIAAPATAFRWLGEPSTLVTYASSERGQRAFCATCGSVAPVVDDATGFVIAPAGNLHGDPGLRPTRHMFVGSKAPWYTIQDSLPRHDEFPPGFNMAAMSRPDPELSAGTTRGSCLCGAVAYETDAAPLRMYYCHCSRCRRARSSAHCANAMYPVAGFRWLRGEELLRDYRLPEAQRFGTAFCARCGSSLPRISVERGVALVPAGSLDGAPAIEATAHIFVESRAPWFDIADALPRYPELPPA